MKAAEVRLLRALEPGESYVEPVFLLVETVLDETGEPVTTIDHVASNVVDGADRWTIKTLSQSVPLTHAAACEWAVSYAASRNIPLVYERDDTLGYAAALSVNVVADGQAASASK